MTHTLKYLIPAISLFFLFSCNPSGNTGDHESTGTYRNIEFNMPIVEEPNIPLFTVNIKDFGAVSGGQVINTEAFQNAIKAVADNGGGKVVIPPGIWLTGPVRLTSKLELHAETGALIRFSPDKDLYPIIETSFEGLETWRCLSPIYGKNIEDVAFTGNGIWDGSGEAWRAVRRNKITEPHWKELVASGGYVDVEEENWYPSEQFMRASENAELNVRKDLKTKVEFEAIRDFLRPVMVSIQNSKRVMLDGPTFQNSPAWCLHPLMVEHLIVRNITVRNPWYSQNGDGIDVESCKNVIVEHSGFDVGDDAICIKSGKDEDGRARGVACENLIIRNNVVYHGHGGVTVGSEMSGGVKNMHVSNCVFMGTDVGLRFKSRRGRGGVVENIYISDISMTDIPTNAISFNLYYQGKSLPELMAEGGMQRSIQEFPVSEETPQFKNISIRNITIDGAHQAVYLQGLPEMNLENITIENLLAKAENGITIIDASGVTLSNIQMEISNSRVFDIIDSKNVLISDTEFNSTATDAILIEGKACENIKLVSDTQTAFEEITRKGEDIAEGVVQFGN